MPGLAGVRPDALLIFGSYHHAAGFPELLSEAARQTGAEIVIGCSAMGIIGMAEELEQTPALALLALSLPGARLSPVRITQSMIDADPHGEEWTKTLGVPAGAVNGWLLFADPFRLNGGLALKALAAAYPGATISGGFASPSAEERKTWLFLNGEVFTDGAVALGIGGDYELAPVVSQGCDPIGEPWTVTAVQSSWIETISNRPALHVVADTLKQLPEEIRLRAQRNLLVGLAANEYRHQFLRGDFLVRNLAGADQATGAIAVGEVPRIGQTIQFQMRDAATADLDLTLMLEQARHKLAGRTPVAGVLCTCNGRGVGLFGTPHHDATAISKKFPGLPLAGCFCAGEIGPIDGVSHVHGFTASLALIVPKA